MTLIGPGDAKHYRVKRGNARWYHDPLSGDDTWDATDQLFPSVSKVKSAKGFEPAKYVAMKACAYDLAENPAKYAGSNGEDIYTMFKGVESRGLAMKRGTAVHNFAEALVKGEEPFTFGEPEEHTRYIPALRAFLDAYQPELVAVETVFYNRSLGYAGTGDIILRIDGKTYMADWKSREEEPEAYPDDGAQVGAYARCEYMVVLDETGNPKRAPLPELDGGIVISVTPTGYDVFPLDLDEAYADFERLYRWYEEKQAFGKKSIGNPWAPRAAPVLTGVPAAEFAIRGAKSPADLYETWTDFRGVWTDELTELAKRRKAELAGK